MTTYNSYEAAKIANNPSDIYKLDNGEFVTGGWVEHRNYDGHTFTLCKPADHCMTLGELRDSHGGEQAGDLILGYSSGSVRAIKDIDAETRSFDCECFVLRAAALENQMNIDKVETQTEHQEEMSAFSGEVEWNGEGLPPVGAECEFKDGDNWYEVKVNYLSEWFMVIEALKSQSKWIDIKGTELSFEYSKFDDLKFRKPETPQQRNDRERLEAAYDLLCIGNRALNVTAPCTVVEFKLDKPQRDFWLAIVDKTNYRKGAKL